MKRYSYKVVKSVYGTDYVQISDEVQKDYGNDAYD